MAQMTGTGYKPPDDQMTQMAGTLVPTARCLDRRSCGSLFWQCRSVHSLASKTTLVPGPDEDGEFRLRGLRGVDGDLWSAAAPRGASKQKPRFKCSDAGMVNYGI